MHGCYHVIIGNFDVCNFLTNQLLPLLHDVQHFIAILCSIIVTVNWKERNVDLTIVRAYSSNSNWNA